MHDLEAIRQLTILFEIAKEKKEVSQALKIYHLIRKLTRATDARYDRLAKAWLERVKKG